jgi:hypothetical protein
LVQLCETDRHLCSGAQELKKIVRSFGLAVKKGCKVLWQIDDRVGANRSIIMQIGSSFQINALALLRPAGKDGAEQAEARGPGASVLGNHGRRHHHVHDHGRVRGPERSDESRMEGRLQKLAAMLQRLTEQNPDAQGASYGAIVLGGRGAVAVAGASGAGTPGDKLVIQAQSISDITTSAGDDQVRLSGATISGVYTGAGSDSLTIVGGVVSGIHTDRAGPVAPPVVDPALVPPVAAAPVPDPVVDAAPIPTSVPVPVAAEAMPVLPEPTLQIDTSGSAAPVVTAASVVAGNDALSVAAYLIRDISTGDGDDALALRGRVVRDVDAGAGNDAIAIKAAVVTGVTGGEGDDAIAVEASVGVAGVSNAAAWFAVAAEPVVATNGEVSASVGAAARAYADIDGGAGNDVISVRTASVLAVAGGAGDDTINAASGAISLVYGAGDGRDTVNVAAGAQVVLQIAEDVAGYTVEFGQDSMTVRMGEGSVTFSGIGAGTVGIKHGDGGMALITQPGAGLDRMA